LEQAERDPQQVLRHQTDARECVRELSALYHPYDLHTGRAQPVERVAQRMGDAWAHVHQLAAAVDLPSRARERIEKAKRVTTRLLATIAFFFATLHAK
jgi:hypothetical protein